MELVQAVAAGMLARLLHRAERAALVAAAAALEVEQRQQQQAGLVVSVAAVAAVAVRITARPARMVAEVAMALSLWSGNHAQLRILSILHAARRSQRALSP